VPADRIARDLSTHHTPATFGPGPGALTAGYSVRAEPDGRTLVCHRIPAAGLDALGPAGARTERAARVAEYGGTLAAAGHRVHHAATRHHGAILLVTADAP
jgi:hypothetical protein